MATVIAVANQKGGVGKTTTTANLGAALARRGCRVLLVDLDPQGNLTSAFGLEKDVQQTVAESLLDRRVPLPVVSVANGSSGNFDGAKHLSVVPAAVGLASAEAQLMNKLGRELRLRDQLMGVDERYDFIMIDTPPSLGVLTINALVAATKVIIPTEARWVQPGPDVRFDAPCVRRATDRRGAAGVTSPGFHGGAHRRRRRWRQQRRESHGRDRCPGRRVHRRQHGQPGSADVNGDAQNPDRRSQCERAGRWR